MGYLTFPLTNLVLFGILVLFHPTWYLTMDQSIHLQRCYHKLTTLHMICRSCYIQGTDSGRCTDETLDSTFRLQDLPFCASYVTYPACLPKSQVRAKRKDVTCYCYHHLSDILLILLEFLLPSLKMLYIYNQF
jgi:hypothetical protein